MKVIWLRKQYQVDLEYASTRQLREAAWQLQAYAVDLKQYLRDNPQAIAALNRLEQIGGEISDSINEGDINRVIKLAEEASKKRHDVAMDMENVDDEGARKSYQIMSDAIRALGGY